MKGSIGLINDVRLVETTMVRPIWRAIPLPRTPQDPEARAEFYVIDETAIGEDMPDLNGASAEDVWYGQKHD